MDDIDAMVLAANMRMRASRERTKRLIEAIDDIRNGFKEAIAKLGPRPRWYRFRARTAWDLRRRAISIEWREHAWETVFPLLEWKPDLVRAYEHLESQLT